MPPSPPLPLTSPRASTAQKTSANLRYVEMLAQDLDASVPHRVEIIAELEPGQEFRMESLCVAGAPTSVNSF
ncbi:MAG: hypothetical protein ACFUZC_10440 [Chthoniobacteraceae bacterium]